MTTFTHQGRPVKRVPGAGRARRVAALAAGLAFLSTWVASSALAQKSPRAQAAAARAREHLAARRYNEAIRELQTAVRYEPRFAFGWYLLASSYRRAGDCDRAVAAYRRYGELRPAAAEPHFGIGLCLETVGDPAGAVAELGRYAAEEKNPAAQSFVTEVQARAEALRPKVAALAKQAALPEPAALVEARKLREQQRLPEAVTVYRKWLAEHPGDETLVAARASAELGGLLIITKDMAAATRALREATRLRPADARAWYDLAFALRHEGQLDDAVAAYSRYVTFVPADPDPYYGLGLSLSKLGRNDQALAALRTYVSLEKRPGEARWVAKARAEIARLSATVSVRAAAGDKPARAPAAATPPSAP